jgi:hypothetical protein
MMARLRCCFGKLCPLCGQRTYRAQTRWFFRPFRILFEYQSSTRGCENCSWWGITFHS